MASELEIINALTVSRLQRVAMKVATRVTASTRHAPPPLDCSVPRPCVSFPLISFLLLQLVDFLMDSLAVVTSMCCC